MPQDSIELQRLRRLLAQEHGIPNVHRLSDVELLRHVQRLPNPWLRHEFRARLHLPRAGTTGEPAPPPEDEPTKTELTWIEFRVIVEATGEPIAGMKMWIRPPSGATQQHTVDADGRVRLEGIEPGSYDVEKMEEPAA